MRKFAAAATLVFGLSATAAAAEESAPPPLAPPTGFGVTVRDVPTAQRMPHSYEVSDGRIMFKATLAGLDVWVLLDNGADRSMVDIAMVDTSGVNKDRPGRTVRTPTGDVPSVLVSPVPMMIPGQAEIRTPLFAIDMAPVSKNIRHEVNAIFGGDLLGQLGFRVDSRTMTFQLVPSGAISPSEDFPFIPLSGTMGQLEMFVGDKPVLVRLDLGSNSSLSLTPEAWARVGPRNQKLERGTSTHADGQVLPVDVGLAPAVRLGSISRRDVVVSVRSWPMAYADGIVGMGFLAGLDFTLDIKAGKLWLRPPTPLMPPLMPLPMPTP